MFYNHFRYYDCDTGQYLSAYPVGLLGGVNPYAYVKNPLTWIDPLGLACCSAYKGKLSGKASEMKPLVKGSKEWKQAIKDSQSALANGEKFQVKVQSSTDGVPKYPKGYEQHMGPEGGFGDTPHIKWYNNGADGHIFSDIPN